MPRDRSMALVCAALIAGVLVAPARAGDAAAGAVAYARAIARAATATRRRFGPLSLRRPTRPPRSTPFSPATAHPTRCAGPTSSPIWPPRAEAPGERPLHTRPFPTGGGGRVTLRGLRARTSARYARAKSVIAPATEPKRATQAPMRRQSLRDSPCAS